MQFPILLGPRFYVLLHEFFLDDPISSVITSHLTATTPSKRTPLMIALCLGKCFKKLEKKVHDQLNREVVPIRRCSPWSGTAGCSGRCVQSHCRVEAAMICPATSLVPSLAGPLCRLVDWPPDPVATTLFGWCHSHRRTENFHYFSDRTRTLLEEFYSTFHK